MFKNYVRVGLRQLKKSPAFAAINIVGLSLAMSVCLLIVTVMTEQHALDRFHPKADQTYRFTTTLTASHGTYPMATSASILGPEMARQSPDVEHYVRLRKASGRFMREDGVMTPFRGLYAEQSFFDVFSFPLAKGDDRTALVDPNSVILGDELARSLFGDEDPVGKTLIRNGTDPFTVTGVLEPMRRRSHLRFEALISMATIPALAGEAGAWDDYSLYYNYLILNEGADPAALESLAARLADPGAVDDGQLLYETQSLTEINMGRDLSNQIAPVLPAGFGWALSLFAVILLSITSLNYISLTVSRTIRRIREVGIRKAMGAGRRDILGQFMVEAAMTIALALLLGMILLNWLIPLFNNLGLIQEEGAQIGISLLDPLLLARFIFFGAVVALIVGFVPALRISRQGSTGLAARDKTSRRSSFVRKLTITGQFAVSMIAIVVTIVLFRQSSFLLEADYGFDEAQLVNIDLRGVDYERLRPQLLALPGVEQVSAANTPPAAGSTWNTDVRPPGRDEDAIVQKFSIDDDFLKMFRVGILAGRGFSEAISSDRESGVLITESAVDFLGLESAENAVGTRLAFDQNLYESDVTIVGVVEDFHTQNYGEGFRPTILGKRPESWLVATVRIHPERVPETIAEIEQIWDQLAPGAPASWAFFDDQIREGFADFRDIIRIFGLFSLLIVAVAVLGLLGMASFTAESRRREVGVRKVLGADTAGMVGLLSKEYLYLILAAILIATPLILVLASKLLERFANRIDVSPALLLSGILPIGLLAVAIVATQTLKAAWTNPVEVIREE